MKPTNNARHAHPTLRPSQLARQQALNAGRWGEYAQPGEHWGQAPAAPDYSRPQHGRTASGRPIRLGRH